ARAQDRGIDHVLAVGSADDDDVLQALDTIDLAEELRDNGVFHVGGDTGAAGAEDGVHLVEEDDDGGTLTRLLPGTLEDQTDMALGFTDVLVEQLRPLDVEEEAF